MPRLIRGFKVASPVKRTLMPFRSSKRSRRLGRRKGRQLRQKIKLQKKQDKRIAIESKIAEILCRTN